MFPDVHRSTIRKSQDIDELDELLGKSWYAYTTEYYSAIQRNALESALTRWMKQEVSRKDKSTYFILRQMCAI